MSPPGRKVSTSSATITPASLSGGVTIKELAEYLGHRDPAFTLRVYAHLLPSSHDRARMVINERFASFKITEQ
jgi:integrase